MTNISAISDYLEKVRDLRYFRAIKELKDPNSLKSLEMMEAVNGTLSMVRSILEKMNTHRPMHPFNLALSKIDETIMWIEQVHETEKVMQEQELEE